MPYSIRNIQRNPRTMQVTAELFELEEKIASGPVGVIVDLAYMYAPGPFSLPAIDTMPNNVVEIKP